MISRQIKKLIQDNPNLSTSALCRLTGSNRRSIEEAKERAKWSHNGKGIPFLSTGLTGGTLGAEINYKVRCKGRTLASCSSMASAMLNVDRLVYCLENNDGKLPSRPEIKTIFDNLGFIK